MNLLRQPLVQFLVIGAVIALAYGLIGDWWNAGADQTVTISAAEIARLEATWQAQWNRPPTSEELDGLIRSQVRERVVYREALAMGLGGDDPVVRRVISQKLDGAFEFPFTAGDADSMADRLAERNAITEFNKIVEYMTGVSPAEVTDPAAKAVASKTKCLPAHVPRLMMAVESDEVIGILLVLSLPSPCHCRG